MRAESAGFAGPLLRQRSLCLVLSAVAGAHLAATAVGLPGWICPWKAATGLPCPGCGITRASLRLLSGDVAGAIQIHPFAPIAVAGLALVLVSATLPEAARGRLIAGVERWDRGGWSSAVLLTGLLAYWAVSLVLDGGG